MDMIERVKRTILKAQFYDCEPDMYESLDEFFHTIDPEHVYVATHMARAAIKAMREPTDRMIELGWDVEELVTPDKTWKAMIDAALNEELNPQ